ncbi:MAG TPA: hypothetical protein PKY59_18305 [Pyrinomonadaceae bacterium]|nr:hypothetical protein [Pyrinomonadaceae bacterium]
MKTLNILLSLLLILSFAAAAEAQKTKRASIKTKPPKKEWIEKEFKQISEAELSNQLCFNDQREKITCPCLTGELTCYKKGSMSVSVKYGRKNKAREILLNGDGGEPFRTAVKLVFGKLTQENYDKLSELMKPKKNAVFTPEEYKKNNNSYEDKHILVEYINFNLMTNYVPQAYRIVWK